MCVFVCIVHVRNLREAVVKGRGCLPRELSGRTGTPGPGRGLLHRSSSLCGFMSVSHLTLLILDVVLETVRIVVRNVTIVV